MAFSLLTPSPVLKLSEALPMLLCDVTLAVII